VSQIVKRLLGKVGQVSRCLFSWAPSPRPDCPPLDKRGNGGRHS